MPIAIAPNRAVAVLTPLVFAPVAGALSVLIAKYVPGVTIDDGSLTAIFVAGATIAFGKSGLWLKGWQDYEKREQAFAHDVVAGDASTPDTEAEILGEAELLGETEMETEVGTELEDEPFLDIDDEMNDETDFDTGPDAGAPEADLNGGTLLAGTKR